MDNFYLIKTKETPYILINYKDNLIKIKGKSGMTDCNIFWEPVIKKINFFFKLKISEIKQVEKNIFKNVLKKSAEIKEEIIIFVFLTHYNIASSKYLYNIFKIIKNAINKGIRVKIKWHCYEKDIQMHENGKEYSKLIGIDFEFYKLKNETNINNKYDTNKDIKKNNLLPNEAENNNDAKDTPEDTSGNISKPKDIFLIESTNQSPYIKIDYKDYLIIIEGNSLMESCESFWKPIFTVLDNFFNRNLKIKTIVSIFLTYINTSSSKSLITIFLIIKKAINSGWKIKVEWNYYEDDDEIYEEGEDYSEMTKIPFEFIEVKNEIKKKIVKNILVNNFNGIRPLIIKKSNETPAIILNPRKDVFQIKGTSWPENAAKFYKPVFEWLEQYFDDTPLQVTNIQFRYEYFNTSSAKQVAKLLHLFKERSKEHNINILWYYYEDNIDMQDEGKRYLSLIDLPFELIEIK